MTIKDFTVGQTAYIFVYDIRKEPSDRIVEAKVVKVGRKYVSVSRKDIRWDARFLLRSDEEPYLVEEADGWTPDILFPSKAAIDDYVETIKLRRCIHEALDWYNIGRYSLEQLRAIKRVLDG